MGSTRLVQKVEASVFQDWISNHEVRVGSHALFRLNEAQRNIFKEAELMLFLRQKPVLVGLQQNGRYAAFFRKGDNYLRIIFERSYKRIEIGTFYITEHLPVIRNGD